MFMAVKYLIKWNLNDYKGGCWFAHCSAFSSEHFSYSHGEYGPLHAKSLQQQNLVSALTHSHSRLSVTQPECFSKFHTNVSFKKNPFCFPLSRFVIELCEPIQVKQLDIANFELFSSTPKDFLVSISDRYTHFSFYFLSINFKTDWHILKGMWWVCDEQRALHWTMRKPPGHYALSSAADTQLSRWRQDYCMYWPCFTEQQLKKAARTRTVANLDIMK